MHAFTISLITAASVLTATPVASAEEGRLNCATYPENRVVSRAAVLERARTWLAEGVPYSMSACHENRLGDYRTDCSGMVSLAWGLRVSYTTANLRDVTTAIDRADLRPGDMLWRRDDQVHHAALFVRWSDEAKTAPVVWQQSGPDGNPANERTWSADYAATYTPHRYVNVVDSGTQPTP